MKNNNTRLINTIREILAERNDVEERYIFKGVHFMINNKMCVAVTGDGMLCRIGPEDYARAIETNGCRAMTMGGKTMKNFVLVNESVLRNRKDFEYWIGLCLAFNPHTKASKKK